MHSRIYEIYVDENDRNEYLNEDDVYEYARYFNVCTDYVVVSEDTRKSDIDWLSNSYPIKDEMLVIEEDYINSYIKTKISEMKEIIDNTSVQKMLGFASDGYKLEKILNDNDGFGFYYGNEVLSMFDLMKYHGKNTYKIGKIFDYHF